MKIALVADWLPTFGGAEHVIAQFCELWPDAPVFTTVANHGHLGPLDRCDVRVSRLQRLYRLLGKHQPLLPLMPRAIEDMDLSGYDVVFTSSHAIAKGIVPPPGALHICYCHTPMRYAWEMEEEYLRDFRVPRLLRRPIRSQLKRLRRWDLTTAKRVDSFLANSTTTAQRIERTYGRQSVVIPPPVEDRFFDTPLRSDHGDYYLAVGRLVPYKRFDLLIETFNRLKLPLRIAGGGQDERRLKRLAGPTIDFLGFVPEEELPALYAGSKAFLFPQLEDAGVVPLEAQACGAPVLALGEGGALDTVRDGATGLFFGEQTLTSLTGAVERFQTRQFDRAAIREHARQFAATRFRQRISEAVDDALAKRSFTAGGRSR